ncbi:hypothetical protein NDN08_008078 [Rhodosorus marinus]|uniref:Geranylgeranyl transferase type II subunit alpha n=1 Tax=Rhodosorus marinus TaxID=101924 RepID=A0AAV8V4C3_9RHOD|nr:hypothetical protein NDN08_008078 [Rhodosorus marinus]
MAKSALEELRLMRRKHPNIDEVGLVHLPGEQYFLLEDEKLGIGVHIVKTIFLEARALLKKSTNEDEAENASFAAVLLNPDYSPAWTIRKDLVRNGFISESRELFVNAVVLCRSSKEFEPWAHRRFLLNRIEWTTKTREVEVGLCSKAAAAKGCNYYAWTHRIIVANSMSTDELLSENETVLQFLTLHVKDCSAWHYRRYLLQRLGRLNEDRFAEDVAKRYGESQSTKAHLKAIAQYQALMRTD